MDKKYFFRMIYILSLLMIVNSCVVPRHIKNTFIGCYDGTPTGIDTILDLSGCFWMSSFVPFRNESFATSCQFLVFYNDGMVSRNGVTMTAGFDDCKAYIQRKLHQVYIGRLNNDEWGLYELKDDTIRVQFINRPNPPAMYNSYIVRYKVIDRHTIQEILFNDTVATYHFMPVEKLPSSDCWLKSEKWFWCNEQDWKDYMQRIRQKKRK